MTSSRSWRSPTSSRPPVAVSPQGRVARARPALRASFTAVAPGMLEIRRRFAFAAADGGRWRIGPSRSGRRHVDRPCSPWPLRAIPSDLVTPVRGSPAAEHGRRPPETSPRPGGMSGGSPEAVDMLRDVGPPRRTRCDDDQSLLGSTHVVSGRRATACSPHHLSGVAPRSSGSRIGRGSERDRHDGADAVVAERQPGPDRTEPATSPSSGPARGRLGPGACAAAGGRSTCRCPRSCGSRWTRRGTVTTLRLSRSPMWPPASRTSTVIQGR